MTVDAPTFYQLQAANRRRSALLIIGVALLLGVLGFLIGAAIVGDPVGGLVVTPIALLITVVTAAFTYYRGDRLVLRASGATEVNPDEHPELMNVVREISLAAGVDPPRVYLIDDTALNAFATGRDPQHASVAVTVGLLEHLDREELQGVIAHELSHVRNLDIRYMLLVGVFVGGIALIADLFLRWSWWGGGRRGGDRGGGSWVIWVVAILFAIVAPLAARLVQLAASRQREYLADATAVELTRNPVGLEGALSKIAGDVEVLEVANRATQHLYIANPIKKFERRASGMFSTHPPIVERIDRLRALRSAPPLDAGERSRLGATEVK